MKSKAMEKEHKAAIRKARKDKAKSRQHWQQ